MPMPNMDTDHALSAQLLIQLLDNGLEKAVGDGLRDSDEASGCGPWLWPGLAITLAVIWEVNQ